MFGRNRSRRQIAPYDAAVRRETAAFVALRAAVARGLPAEEVAELRAAWVRAARDTAATWERLRSSVDHHAA